MKMYIANASLQYHRFNYRAPEITQMRGVEIPPMQQRVLPDDLNQLQIDAIVNQMAVYGFPSIDEFKAGRTVGKKHIRLCYSVDKPISAIAIQALYDSNHKALVELGDHVQKETAIVSHKAIEDSFENERRKTGLTPPDIRNFEATLQEDFNEKEDLGHDPVTKGFRVHKDRTTEHTMKASRKHK